MSDVEKIVCFSGDVMLAGWAESHTAGCKVTFWLEDAAQLDTFRHMTAKKGNTAGQRFLMVLVELNEQEEAVVPEKTPMGPLCTEAVGFCNRDDFRTWVRRASGFQCSEDQAGARQFVLRYCRVRSRKELDTNPTAALLWGDLKANYYRHNNPDWEDSHG